MSLASTAPVRALLDASVRWHTVRHEAVVGSTNDVALEAMRRGEPPGLVVVADRQTAGRGRRGRTWIDDVHARAGPTNLAVTATCPATRHAGVTPLATGLAVVDAFSHAGADAWLKWPNDVLLGGCKAAGILVERHAVTGVDLLLIGCGLDIDWRGVVRSDASAGWTSLAEVIDDDVDRAEVLAAYLASLHRWLDVLDHDQGGVLAEYRRRCATLGARVRIALPDGDTLEGEAVRVDDDGQLIVRGPRGEVVVTAGGITHLRARR